jgi:hypothetical protein
MFFTISNDKEYNDNQFGRMIRNNMDALQDCVIIFREHLFLILADQKETFFAEVYRINNKDNNVFNCSLLERNIPISSYLSIGETLRTEIFKIYDIENKIPMEEILFSFVDDFEDIVKT